MARFAELVPAPPRRASASALAAKAKTRPQEQGPARPPAGVQIIQLRAAEKTASAPEPAAAPYHGTLPARLRAGIESLSGLCMGDVRVHRDSAEPAKLGALAFTRGADIHLGPGQERHLPHEAWHVVQQKQGRVAATAQMKGAAVNADARLEAEADRMGEAALRGGAGLAAAPERRSAPAGIVQAKVKSGDAVMDKDWLDKNDKSAAPVQLSATLRAFIRKPEGYMLRDDFTGPRLMEPVIHLIDMGTKYLLGEQHGDAANAKWRTETGIWSKVSKMFEWNKALPRDERADVAMPPDADLQDLALESRHAYLLATLLGAIDQINVIGASWVKTLWTDPKHKDFIVSLFTSADEELSATDFAHREYAAFIPLYQARKNTSARAKQVYRFAVRFKDVFHPAIETLRPALAKCKEAIAGYAPDDKAKAADTAKAVAKGLKGIADDHGFLRQMAREVIELNAIADQAERKRLLKLTRPVDEGRGVEILNATTPVRERGMADNIAKAAAPLLVKTGNDHLPGLKALVGGAIETIDASESLEKATKRS